MSYWLLKSEGSCYSIDDLKRDKRAAWTGIRNYQARNYMRDGMKQGDLCLFYHSNGTPEAPTGVYGVAKVVSASHIDETALDPKDEHYDPKAVAAAKAGKDPLWVCVDVAFAQKLARPVSLDEIKKDPALKTMLVLRPGQRLSVMPVEEKHFKRIVEKGGMGK
jgi:predicted RNA-binding protein with PUA-like domain